MGFISQEDATSASNAEPLAIIGMAWKFPQNTDSADDLWKLMLDSRSTNTAFPEDRLNANAFYHPDPEHGGTFHVKGGHFLGEDPALFDSAFFKMSKAEVLTLDPQQRVVMENVYHALENAGISMPQVVKSKTSVFATGFNHDHRSLLNIDPETTLKYKPTGVSSSIISNRVSWFFDLRGPSLTIDTACSSSMVALHLAAQSLKGHESEMVSVLCFIHLLGNPPADQSQLKHTAVANNIRYNQAIISGVSILEHPLETQSMSHHGFLGPEGQCFSFDRQAEGYARGEGVGTLIVKTLRSAVRDGDTIRAVVRGTGVNQDGQTQGINLPSQEAQESLIRDVYRDAGIGFQDTMFVEAHGTGTLAGDPLEATALARVFRPSHEEVPLYVGAVKSNIGHLEGGSGVAGIIKAVLALEKGIIPPNSNLEAPNQKIPVKQWNIVFPKQAVPWPTDGVRRVSVNSFGFGGTNAHCVLDDAFHYLEDNRLSAPHNTSPTVPSYLEISNLSQSLSNEQNSSSASEDSSPTDHQECDNRTKTIIPISSFDRDGVRRNALALARYISSKEKTSTEELLCDLSITLSKNRTLFPWRAFVLTASLPELQSKLTANDLESSVSRAHENAKIGFIFTGQGAQYQSMGRELMSFSAFRESIEQASAFMTKLWSPWSLIDEMLSEKEDSQMDRPELSHPSSLALQVALVDLLNSWGIFPSQTIGHSSGETAAAYAAGKLSREAAWTVGYYRGYVCAKVEKKGGMLAVGLGQQELSPYIKKIRESHDGELKIACYNSPTNNTVSGDEKLIEALMKELDQSQVFNRKLNVKNAYHSAHMKEAAKEYLQLMGNLPEGHMVSQPSHMFSSITGQRVESSRLEADYWAKNLVSPVCFTSGLHRLCFHDANGRAVQDENSTKHESSVDHIIEIGSHSTLQSCIKEILASHNAREMITYLPTLKRSARTSEPLLQSVATLQAHGARIDVHAVNRSSACPVNGKFLTDLPPYQFDHADKSIYESRLSKNLRLRPHPRHDLFGAPVIDWNPESPRWRHFFRLNENPWLEDHKVTGSCIYPGVGYIIMVIEASKQIADPYRDISGFRLKQVSLKRALVIPDTREGIETCLSMSSVDESALSSSSTWKRFQIWSYNEAEDVWIEHCTGYISVEYKPNPPADSTSQSLTATESSQALHRASQVCQTPFDFSQGYDRFNETGLSFGPLFRNLSNVRLSGARLGSALGQVIAPDIAQVMPKKYMHSHSIHPATMDSMVHIWIAAMLDLLGKESLDHPSVPTFVREAWVSADISSEKGRVYHVHGAASLVAYDKYECDLQSWDDERQANVLQLNGVRVTPLESGGGDSSDGSGGICHQTQWQPDVNFLTPATISSLFPPPRCDAGAEKHWMKSFQLASTLMITKALSVLEDSGFQPESLHGHLKNYHAWLCHFRDELLEDRITGLSLNDFNSIVNDEPKKECLYREVEDYDAGGALAIRMGFNIVKVLTGEVDPMQLMFGEDNLLGQVYDQHIHKGDLAFHLKNYLSVLAGNRKNLRILEIGAGTGSSTEPILDALCPIVSNDETDELENWAVSQYVFTDISAGFFEKAKQRFVKWDRLMEYKILDIEKDVASQGFDIAHYDLVVAGNVIHATQDVRDTLGNVRELLKPGGHVLMHEIVRRDLLWTPLAFGQLAGWWLSKEESRAWGPTMPSSEWDVVFKDSGFSGVDMELPSSSIPEFKTQSILVSTAKSKPETPPVSIKILVSKSDVQLMVTSDLIQRLQNFGWNATAITMSDLHRQTDSQSTYISLLEIDQPLMTECQEDDYLNLRNLLTTCKRLLWVTGSATQVPKLNAIIGLLRTIRSERDLDEANLMSLELDSESGCEDLVEVIPSLLRHHLEAGNESTDNSEYLYQGEMIYTSRLVESSSSSNFLTARFSKAKPEMTPFGEVDRPIKLSISNPGMLRGLEWVTDEDPSTNLPDTSVEIEIHAVGLNFRDVMIAMGEYLANSFGSEGAGIVTRVGNQVTKVKPGDRVVFLGGLDAGCFNTFGRADQNLVVPLPNNISYASGASLPCVYTTVLYGLREIGRLSEGEAILIHAAAGGVGQAAIQYAHIVGATVYATVSTPEKRSLLTTTYGIPNENIFSSRDLGFAAGIMEATGGRGVDVVLNSLSGDALRKSWECIAPLGRFVEIGKRDAQSYGRVELTPFLRNVTMSSVELTILMRQKPQMVGRILADVVELFNQGEIHEATPTTILKYSEVERGLRQLQGGKGMGKIVFTRQNEDPIPVVQPPPSPYQFDPNASYVLAGGLGGVGRSISRWMASHGAKQLIFLSRSRPVESEAVKQLLDDLESTGCRAKTLICDIADSVAVKQVLGECATSLPPIKGCIQCAMVLKDALFENMSYNDWKAALQPKVLGTWNLHEALPLDIDFFGMLSSVTGIMGNKSQSNYAAGNTFQDALARHRNSKGLPSWSVDLGAVHGIGFIAENMRYARRTTDILQSIQEDQVHAILEYLIRTPATNYLTHDSYNGNITAGLSTERIFNEGSVPAPSYFRFPLFTHLQNSSIASNGSLQQGSNMHVESLLQAAKTREEAVDAACQGITNKLSSLLGVRGLGV
ncbi:unnamed protein product [Penicillium salamii]|nr:unnamed protein product [Penicillium salamii]